MWKKIKSILRKKLNRSLDKTEIDVEELKKLVDNGATLIDVRSLQEFNEGHLDNAISIPEFELRSRAKEELKNKDEIIVVYCTTGSRSKRAKQELLKMGYKNIYNLYNGTDNYSILYNKI